MRTLDDRDDVPSDGSSSDEGLGDGYQPDFENGYGTDFEDEYDTSYDEEEYEEDEYDEDKPSSDTTPVDETDDGLDVDLSGVDVAELTEEESEEILVDALEEEYGEEADEVLEDLEASTGMSAHEILEVLDGDPYDEASSGATASVASGTGPGGGDASPDLNPFDG
jgi:hypothetical protein